MSSIPSRLADLLGQARRPGDFYAQGTIELLPPSLSVRGVGPISLPLLPAQVTELIAVAEHAPYGRGPETIVDTSVRNTWQVGPDRVDIGGRHWPKTLAAILDLVSEGLGVGEPIEAEFYKMLIYDPGSFFIGHRDSEKTLGMFATLVIVLPSACTGGQLLVRHKDRSVSLDLQVGDPAEAAFAAFYADCLHEVLPVTAGCRLTLVYNLIRRGKGQAPRPPDYTGEHAQVADLLRDWRTAMAAEGDDNVPRKLVYPLEHAYTPAGLDFSMLKGADAAAAGVLAAAATQADCALHLALVTLEEFGAAEYSDTYGGHRRWSHGDDGDDEFEAGEIDDWNIALSNWCAPSGDPVSWGELPVTPDELSPPDPFHELEPDELHFEEASGNAGVSFERRYRRAALVVWPNERAFAVLSQAGLGITVPHLNDIAGRWALSKADQASSIWREAHELAGHIIDSWPANGRPPYPATADSETTGLLIALTRLGDLQRITEFLTRVVSIGTFYGKHDNAAILAALALFPSDQAATLLTKIVTANAAKRFAGCADLLARAAIGQSVVPQADLKDAAATLVALLPTQSTTAASYDWTGRTDNVDPAFVGDLLIGLGAVDRGLADRALTQILAHPKMYDPDRILVPAARDKLRGAGTAGQPAVARLRVVCLAHLRARIGEPLEPPTDWKRPSAVGCKCPRCNELSRFLANPREQTWILRAAAADRTHVEGTIATAACDLDTRTEQRGRPYSLVCTKNQASYERRVKQRQQDLKDEATLAAN